MTSTILESAVRQLRVLATQTTAASDRDLLTQFLATGDEPAFAAIVARHGPEVLGVCRRVLQNRHDAEDAFQATFLVLARQAKAIQKSGSVRCWLHGVAFRVASRLKRQRTRQSHAELPDVPGEPQDDVSWRDVRRVLDEELNALPERLREPLVLCYLEGLTRDEAAQSLGLKISTLRGRLEDGRERLRVRLVRRGVELSAVLLALSATNRVEAVSTQLMSNAVCAGIGKAPDTIKALAEGIAMTAATGKIKWLATALLVGILGVGAMATLSGGTAGDAPTTTPTSADPPATKPPGAPVESDPLAALKELADAADRIWVVKSPTVGKPPPEPEEVLKGSTPPEKGYGFTFDVAGLKELPAADPDRKWIVFLRSVDDEVDFKPQVSPLPRKVWYLPFDPAVVAALKAYVPPMEWGEAKNGLRLGLRVRPDRRVTSPTIERLKEAFGDHSPEAEPTFYPTQLELRNGESTVVAACDETVVEVAVQNVGKVPLAIDQFRGNYFDDWRPLDFTLKTPDGKQWKLIRLGKPHKDSDAPRLRTLQPGETYVHAVRIARWEFEGEDQKLKSAAKLFEARGKYEITAHYEFGSDTGGKRPEGWWTGTLTSGTVTTTDPVGKVDPVREMDPTLREMTLKADRIWIVPSPTKEQPIPKPERVLKGSRLPDSTSVLDLRLLPAEDPKQKWIVFLTSEEDGTPIPKVGVWPRSKWYWPDDETTVKQIQAVLLPSKWGERDNGLQMGLRLRDEKVTAGQPVVAEVVIQNVSQRDNTLFQLRYNVYDYWYARFVVTDPNGVRWELEKRERENNEKDFPSKITLKPGEIYVHTMRLDKWPGTSSGVRVKETDTNRLTIPGDYIIESIYQLTDGHEPPRWWIGKLTSPPMKLTVTKAAEWGEATDGIKARLRLAKTRLKPGEPLIFELDLRNDGPKAKTLLPIPFNCDVECDGKLYRFLGAFDYTCLPKEIQPGGEVVPFVKVTIDMNWIAGVLGVPLVPNALTIGEHSLRVSFPLGEKARVQSSPVTIVIDRDDLTTLAVAADRIVVAKLVGKDKPGLKPTRMLKGPNNNWQPDVQTIDVPPGADVIPIDKPEQEWILYLKAEEDGREVPKLSPAAAKGWFRPATAETIREVLAALPPVLETGKTVNGLSLGLRRSGSPIKVGDDIRLEVLLTSHWKGTPRVLQQRYNVYDYWPFLEFTVTAPNGRTYVLTKLEGVFKREDYVDEVVLKEGESYVHAIRLNRWPSKLSDPPVKGGTPVLFTQPGTYKIEARYKCPLGFKNINPLTAFDDWPFWNGELKSNVLSVEVKANGPVPPTDPKGTTVEGLKFDAVRVLEKAGEPTQLYVVLTDPKADLERCRALVVKYAVAALREAQKYDAHKVNVVFFIRHAADSEVGAYTGFSVEDLKAIAAVTRDEAMKLASAAAWAAFGKLPPAQKK